MDYSACKIGYVVADLKRVGPTNQTLNIIRYSGAIRNCVVITLFDEPADTRIQDYRDLGISVVCLHLTRKNILIKGVPALARILKDLKVDLVHSWGTFADITSYYTCKKTAIPHMITLRNFPVEEMTTRMNYLLGILVAKFDLHILKNCKHVVCCSKSIKKKMEDAYHWSHLHSIQNGVDVNTFRQQNRQLIRTELGVTENELIFIATGSMIPRKHIPETIDAFLASKTNFPKKLWLLGDGNLLEQYKKEYAQNPDIVFWGKQSDVSRYLSAADVFISSSESEGMPNAVLEALACNLPVYLSDIPQHMEVFDFIPGCGKYYPLGNSDKLAALINETNIAEIAEMQKKAGYLFNSPFTMKNMGLKYAEYYKTIM